MFRLGAWIAPPIKRLLIRITIDADGEAAGGGGTAAGSAVVCCLDHDDHDDDDDYENDNYDNDDWQSGWNVNLLPGPWHCQAEPAFKGPTH